MRKIQKMFKALSIKNALDIYLLIYSACKIEYYVGFNELRDKTKLNENTLRRITNALSSSKLIKSIRFGGRTRKYIVTDKEFADKIIEIITPFN